MNFLTVVCIEDGMSGITTYRPMIIYSSLIPKEQIDEYIRKINEMINIIVEKSDSPLLLLK